MPTFGPMEQVLERRSNSRKGIPNKLPTAVQRAKTFILNNPHTTRAEVCGAIGCSPRIVDQARKELRDDGLVIRYSATKKRHNPDMLLAPVEHSDEPVQADELHRLISKKLRGARSADEFRPLAAELIKLLPKPETEDESLGPVAPLNHEEMVERGGLILQSLGAEQSMQAVEWARKYVPGESTVEQPKQPEEDANHPNAV